VKPLIFCLILVFLFTQKTHAQAKSFNGGVFFNTNGIHFSGDSEIFWQGPNGKVWGGGGLSGGIYVTRNFSESFYFGLELRYVQKGSVFEYGNEFGTRSVETMRINYAEIPVMIGYEFKTPKRLFSIETGMAFARQISSDLNLNLLSREDEISKIDQFKTNDLSWVTSFKIPINKKENLLLGIRNSVSLQSIHNYYHLRNWVYGIQLDYLIR